MRPPLVHLLVEQHAAEHPSQVAISQGGESLTYAALDAQANRLAHALLARGAGPDRVIGICLPRSTRLVVSLLAVLKTGAAWLPLDPSSPPERLRHMATSAGAMAVIGEGVAAERLAASGLQVLLLPERELASFPDVNPEVRVLPDQLAYVIHTSGSTGLPKGVMISHRALAAFTAHHRATFALSPADRVGVVASLGFDALVMSILPSLASGARLELPEDEETRLSPRKLQEWLLARDITFAFLPTPLAERVLALPWPETCALRLLLTGGDRLHVRPRPGMPFQFVNGYGPAECTIYCTSNVVPPARASHEERLPSIGRPIDGAEIHLLDPALRPVAEAETGEIFIGGTGLARGYVEAPGLTAERFIPHPFSPTGGERLYRTGDLGRRAPDGSLEFLGRVDSQVKVRGIRIEPAEITAALQTHPHVGAAHVMARSTGALTPDGDVFFVAWFTPRDARAVPGTEQLREHLRAWLPEAMMPRTFVVVDALPLGPNGKVDVQALPVPALHAPRSREYVAPRTELEQGLARVWQEELRLEQVGLQDDFFELGGHSLLATRITSRIEDTLGLCVSLAQLFAHPRIALLAELLESRGAALAKDVLPPVVRAADPSRAPLSVQQEQVWFLQKLSPDSISYQAQTTLRVMGGLDLPVLERALTELTRRHELLRTTYEEVDGRPWQCVQPVTPVRVPLLDLSALPEDVRERRREEAIREELRRPLSLFALPLARWSALRLAPDEHEIVLVEHHVVHDGVSFSVLMRELDALYNAYLRGEDSPLPEPAVQYRDFAVWQRAALEAPGMKAQLAYWRERLAGAPEVLPLRTDRPRPPVQGFNGDLLRLELPPALPGALRTFCQREGVTLFHALFSAFATLLHRYTGEQDLCIGSAFAARAGIRNIENLIGMFVNAVVLRCDVSGAPSFRQLVHQVKDITSAAAEHQTYPFLKLVEALGVKRDPSRNPLIQAMFSFHDSAVPSPRLGSASCTIFERGNGSSKVDLDVVAIPHAGRHLGDASRGDDRISLIWEYNRDLFDRATMERMSAHFLRLLEVAVRSPDTAVSRLPMLTDAEQHALLSERNGPEVSTAEPPVQLQVLEQARRTPGAVAVRDEAGALTYAELIRRATLLAEHLRRQGTAASSLIGICAPRGAELVTAELGVLLAGAAYLPLDPEHPAERLALLLADGGVRQVVTTGALRERLPATLEQVCVEDFHAPGTPRGQPSADARPGQLAYVMYTSGSTGTPKGVMVEHGSLSNLVGWHRRAFGLDANSRATLLYSPAFDPSAAEIWPALTAGATLHVPGQDVRLSPERLQAWLLSERITFTDLPTTLVERLLALAWPDACELRTVLAGGDRLLSRPRPGMPWRLFNQYGPTETTVTATSSEVLASGPEASLPAIGRPIAGTTAYVLDAELQPVPLGAGGALYLGGAGVARGYLNRPDLTASSFIPDPFSSRPGARLYRTGDHVRIRPDGELEFLGRMDAQLKLRGFRVEPAEISARLRTCPGIAEAHVRAWSAPGAEPRLVGYLVPRAGHAVPSPARLREHLARELPAYMIPSAYVELGALPLTHGGKVDERALPAPTVTQASQVPLANELERQLAGLWCETLRLERVGAEDNFFDLGGHSLLLGQVQHLLKSRLGHDVPMVKLFEFPTVRALAGHLQGQGDGGAAAVAREQRQEQRQSGLARMMGRAETAGGGQHAGGAGTGSSVTPWEDRSAHIAVVGLACRFPGATNAEAFWANLAGGVESITFFGPDGHPREQPPGEAAVGEEVPAFGLVADADRFDAAAFGCSPQEALMLDPQQRVFLECAREALEDAGYDPARYPGAIGLYAGGSETSYLSALRARRELLAGASDWQLRLATGMDFLTSRVAYKLGLRGPAVTVQTACSTSLVAIHLAAQALLAGDCDIALAGGASVHAPPRFGHYSEGGPLSPDGRCRAFDAKAQGTVGSNGAGLVVLKRLADALADGDTIRAVLRGSAINNDAAGKIGFTAPSVEGQASVIETALRVAGVTSESITAIEAHGTGTRLGDPIELAALTKAFDTRQRQFCWIGSVKTNIGHTDAAAGVAGFIKTVLALEHRKLPPSLNFEQPNPEIDFEHSPFRVNTQLRDWDTGGLPRRAGVSSLGIGGTNAHVVLEEAPASSESQRTRTPQLLVLSAHGPAALARAVDRLGGHLRAHPDIPLGDVAWTLQVGRTVLAHRAFAVGQDTADVLRALEEQQGPASDARPEPGPRPVVFMFPGHGGQHVGMGRELYAAQPAFREAVDACRAHLTPVLGFDLGTVLHPDPSDAVACERASARMGEFVTGQLCVFVIEYAVARLWERWGVKPAAVVGHSLGAYAAATVAGVFCLEDALRLVLERSRILASLPSGAMLAVPLPESELRPLLHAGLSLAAVNGPAQCVVSGPVADIEALQARLTASGVESRLLRIPGAGHSHLVEPSLAAFTDCVQRIERHPPTLPWISDLTGAAVTAEQAVDPAYWAAHLRHTVRFGDALGTLLAGPASLFLEVGPGRTLATLARQHPDAGTHLTVATLPHPADNTSDLVSALTAAGRLWTAGVPLSWQELHAGVRPQRVPLPTYPFERQRYLVEAPNPATPVTRLAEAEAIPPVHAASAITAGQEQPEAGDDATVRRIATAFAEVLGLPRVGLHDNFFELGGDSLMAAQLIARLRPHVSTPLRVKAIFRSPTVARLARFLEEAASTASPPTGSSSQ
ncbi:non-ribosomal peptide synthetase/type I polyketide synthase [Corallococcus terminator]|uniref:non-ribosomal peptide synthetase/type I polyketide synthase n=1 Tax=Corallococcus terminator TaxID=2316733 RepID=UPI0013150877|nr:non-ribosomal peptide synthetase/type I polyketide synthase [Corallococcus terminator]